MLPSPKPGFSKEAGLLGHFHSLFLVTKLQLDDGLSAKLRFALPSN
jgi:hypothetical protein